MRSSWKIWSVFALWGCEGTTAPARGEPSGAVDAGSPTSDDAASVERDSSPTQLLDGNTSQEVPDAVVSTDADAGSPDSETLRTRSCAVRGANGEALLDLGQSSQDHFVGDLDITQDRIASVEEGHWLLQALDTGAHIAKGELQGSGSVFMRGNLLITYHETGDQLHDTTDGRVIGVIAHDQSYYLGPALVAPDGSYVCTAGRDELRLWSRSGEVILRRADITNAASLYITESEVRVAKGPAGADVIETIDVRSGASSTSAPFVGTFVRWFQDGERFLTKDNSTMRIYAQDGALLASVEMSSNETVYGYGEYYWTITEIGLPVYRFNLYRVGGGANPILSRETGDVQISSHLLAMFDPTFSPYGPPLTAGDIWTLDLRSPDPMLRATGISGPQERRKFAANADGAWAVLDEDGLIRRRMATSDHTDALTCGPVQALAFANGGTLAVATAAGQVLVTNVEPTARLRVIQDSATALRISDDGKVLVTWESAQGVYGVKARVYDLSVDPPQLLQEFVTSDVSLARSGRRIAQHTCGSPFQVTCQLRISDPAGTDYVVDEIVDEPGGRGALETLPPFVLFSPSGSRWIQQAVGSATGASADVYEEGSKLTSLAGLPVLWLDEERLLMLQRVNTTGGAQTAVVMDRNGDIKTSFVLARRELASATALNGGAQFYFAPAHDNRYYPSQGVIYDANTGLVLWTEFGDGVAGAANDTHAVFTDGEIVKLTPHP